MSSPLISLNFQSNISARYLRNTSQTISNNTSTILNFDVKDWDMSPECVTTGASWKFTCPAGGDGKFLVTFGATLAAASGWAVYESFALRVFKNGTVHNFCASYSEGTHASYMSVYASDLVSLVAGDYIDLRVLHNNGASQDVTATSVGENFISIVKIAN